MLDVDVTRSSADFGLYNSTCLQRGTEKLD